MDDELWALVDVMLSMPAMVANDFSSGVRHRRGHRLRARARKARVDRDRRIVDRREVADRELGIRDDAKEQNAAHDQRGHDRQADKERGEVHLGTSRRWGPISFSPAGAPRGRRGGTGSAGATRQRPHGDLRSVLQSRLPVGDDVVAFRKSATDHVQRIGRAGNGHGLLPHRVGLRIEDEHVRALLSGHHGLRRDDEGILLHVEAQHRRDVFTRPQLALSIGERALQQHGTRRRVDGVVDERHRPGDRGPAAAISVDAPYTPPPGGPPPNASSVAPEAAPEPPFPPPLSVAAPAPPLPPPCPDVAGADRFGGPLAAGSVPSAACCPPCRRPSPDRDPPAEGPTAEPDGASPLGSAAEVGCPLGGAAGAPCGPATWYTVTGSAPPSAYF